MGYTPTAEQLKALEQLKVRSFSTDLRRFSLDQIRTEFAAPTSGRVLLIPLIRNIVYQAATRMIEGSAPKVEGNLRSLYYSMFKFFSLDTASIGLRGTYGYE